jgi:diguanylate cyclase
MLNQDSITVKQNVQFEEKVFVIANEVLIILKELSRENKKQISSKLIAEKMFWSDPVKSLLSAGGLKHSATNDSSDTTKELSAFILDKFSELVPSSMSENFRQLKDSIDERIVNETSQDWLEIPIQEIKAYIDSISGTTKEFEVFTKQVMTYLAETEMHLSHELSVQHQRYESDRMFEDSISSDINHIGNNFSTHNDFSSIKTVVLKKIGNITKNIRKKRGQDLLRLKETEEALKHMNAQLETIKNEATVIKTRASEIEYDSVRDSLTGLYNRKAYDQKITEMLAHVSRYNATSCLMVCDIDHFKKINDTFGHRVGDRALKKIASLLKERLRTNDFIARYGGEEFAIILPYTNLDGALQAGEGLRSYISESTFSYSKQTIPLTISLGISIFRKDDDDNTVFERADNALYLAKRTGRNCIKSENDILDNVIEINQKPLK